MLFGSVTFKEIIDDLKDIDISKAVKDGKKYEKVYGSDEPINRYLTELVITCGSIYNFDMNPSLEHSKFLMKMEDNNVSAITTILASIINNDYSAASSLISNLDNGDYKSDNLSIYYKNDVPVVDILGSIILFSINEFEMASSMIKNAIEADKNERFLGEEYLIQSLIHLVKKTPIESKKDIGNALQLGYKSDKAIIEKILRLARSNSSDNESIKKIFANLRDDLIKDISYDILYNVVFGKTDDNFYKSDADMQITKFESSIKPKEKYKDLVDMEKQKEELSKYVIYPLQYKGTESNYGVDVGGGILLYGPPGCGKTYITMATAGEASINFINVKIPDILDAYVGNTEKNIHNLFEYARENAPSIIFFDELDALGGSRSESNETWSRQAVNTILSEMNDLYNNGHPVAVIGATNEPWLIDSALRRSGRFGNLIYAPPPNAEVRVSLFRKYLFGKPLSNDIDFNKLALMTKNASHSDIKSICDDASRDAWARSIKRATMNIPITMDDLTNAISKVKFVLPEWYHMTINSLGNGISDYPDLKEDVMRFLKESRSST